ncbi:cysteine rich repeat-containing protein [Nitrospira moscoviensis]|uniref:Putative Exported protein n=1 Tax=Nitrospira moscoviensis TaxID=42253 RepID=A0A0K2GA88_NITMO|nr:cysteine rich repeat-containing protein [Nitrospira moscoviensis]ALA57860.1 putative Exported protein [Nitrospira moscoviensis]
MKSASPPAASGKATAILVSLVGLMLVWGIVWANLPSQYELLSGQPKEAASAAPPPAVELDLSIPGVPPPSVRTGRPNPERLSEPGRGREFAGTGNAHARQIAEVKCEAEVQQACPESLGGEERRRCVAQRMKQFPPFCQQIVRQRVVRWKAAEGYKAACADDLKRLCPTVEPGEGPLLQCLQEHAQDISESCYQSLPKGRLLLRR